MQTVVDLIQFSDPAAASNWIQIMKTGEWNHPTLGKIAMTQADLARFKENFDARVRGTEIAVDVSHNPDKGAVGWFKELHVDGDKLMARVEWTEEGAELIKSGKFRYFSPEFMFKWTDPESGKEYRDVLFGGAITNRPFLKNMSPIEFGEDELGVVWFADAEGRQVYDPDGDGDDDSTTDPDDNPDWIQDVEMGHTPFDVASAKQKEQLNRRGITKQSADDARKKFLDAHPEHKGVKFSEDGVKNGHKSPPKGYPTDKSQYADPDHYKWPIDEKHIQAAVSMFNNSENQEKGGYSGSQWAEMGRKIASAANTHIGAGHSFKDGKIETPSTNKMGEHLNPDDGSQQQRQIDDDEAGKFTDPAGHTNSNRGGGNSMETVSLSEHQKALDRIVLLETEQRQTKMSEKVDALIRSGKIVPAQKANMVELLVGMSDDQVTKWAEVMDKSPAVVSFTETGFAGNPGTPNAEDLLMELTEKYVKEGKSHREAASIAFKEVEARGLKLNI